jgi:hypothetical protein
MIGRAPRSGGHLAITPSRSRNVSASLLAAQVPKLPAAQLDSQAGGAQSPHRAPGHLELLCCRDLYSCDKFLDRTVDGARGARGEPVFRSTLVAPCKPALHPSVR